MSSKRLILASGSPRRAELLQQMGLRFEVRVPDVDETPLAEEAAADYVQRMARIKAAAVEPGEDAVVLAADTVVVLDGRILGKPADREAGIAMLCALGGREHQVLTAITGRTRDSASSDLVSTLVRFVPVDESLAARLLGDGGGRRQGRQLWYSGYWGYIGRKHYRQLQRRRGPAVAGNRAPARWSRRRHLEGASAVTEDPTYG